MKFFNKSSFQNYFKKIWENRCHFAPENLITHPIVEKIAVVACYSKHAYVWGVEKQLKQSVLHTYNVLKNKNKSQCSEMYQHLRSLDVPKFNLGHQ